MPITIYSRFNKPPQVSIKFNKPSLTEQCHKDSCDIDVILKRYQQTGFLVDPLQQTDRTPSFGDFSDMEGYQEYQNRLISIKEHFEALPSRIRLLFGNDVGNYLQAMNDPRRTDELIDLGLLKRATTNEQTPSNISPLDRGSNAQQSDISESKISPAEGEISVGTVSPT